MKSFRKVFTQNSLYNCMLWYFSKHIRKWFLRLFGQNLVFLQQVFRHVNHGNFHNLARTLIGWPIIPSLPWLWAFSLLCAMIVCTWIGKCMHFVPKLYNFIRNGLNAYMWSPLVFGLQGVPVPNEFRFWIFLHWLLVIGSFHQ